MNNCNVLEEVTTKATRALYNIAPPVPPPSQEIPPVLEQVQPPAPVVTYLPPPSAQPSREMKVTEKTKALGNKKRKIPPLTTTDAVMLGKSNASQVPQETNQIKLAGADTNAEQEKPQAKLKGSDVGHVKAGEERRKSKEGEKAKRPRVNDGGSRAPILSQIQLFAFYWVFSEVRCHLYRCESFWEGTYSNTWQPGTSRGKKFEALRRSFRWW